MAVFLPAIAPVSLIILIGFLLGRFLTLDRQTLSKLAIYALSPALIGGNLYRSTLSVVSALKIILGFAIA
ncbi:MAG: AEC family transporter, partial [Spirulinaceae cyanobacterium]